jgi:hypothetical protein
MVCAESPSASLSVHLHGKEPVMSTFEPGAPVTRRRALAMGAAGVAGSLFASTSFGMNGVSAQTADSSSDPSGVVSPDWQGTIREIEEIIGAQGMVSNGVSSIEIDRDDIKNVTLGGVAILPSFEINGTLYFQDLGHGRAAMNSDMALKGSEINNFIDQLLRHGIVFQAEHSTSMTSRRRSGSFTSVPSATRCGSRKESRRRLT